METHAIQMCHPVMMMPVADRDSTRPYTAAAADSHPDRLTAMSLSAFRSAPATPRNKSGAKGRAVSAARHAQLDLAGLDEEGIRTRRYWQRWGDKAARELLMQPDEDDDVNASAAVRKETVYSGRIGRTLAPPVKSGTLTRGRSPSPDSSSTDISLLTCSSVNRKVTTKRRHLKKKKAAPAPPVEEKTDWVKLAKERRGGMLDRMLQKDVSAMQGASRSPGNTFVERASGIFSSEDMSLLQSCGKKRGLMTLVEKSYSTENVLSTTAQQSPPSTKGSKRSNQSSGSVNSGTQGHIAVTGSGTPSPRLIAEKECPRPNSSIARVKASENDGTRATTPRTVERLAVSPFSVERTVSPVSGLTRPSTKSRTVGSHVKGRSTGTGKSNSKLSRKVRARMRNTVIALERVTGYGDATDVITTVDDEHGRYTAADYARIARYPQNIRIAPQLSRIISEDICQRMGRPRRHEIRTNDLRALDADQPALDRSHRNLLIFNWLITLDGNKFDYTRPPEIADLEGRAPVERAYPEIYSDIVGGLYSRPSTVMRSETGWDSAGDDVDDEQE